MARPSGARDRLALGRVRLAAVVGLAASIAGIVSLVVFEAAVPPFTATGSLSSNGTGPGTTFNFAFPSTIVVFAVIGLVAVVSEYLLFWSGFRALSPDAPEFSTPSTLALFAVVGVTIAILGALVVLYALAQASPCFTSVSPGSSPCFLTGGFWAGIAGLALGGILGLIGVIGVLIGIWRLGTRYDNVLLKVAAVLLIVPYVSVAGDILLLVGAGQAIGRGSRR